MRLLVCVLLLLAPACFAQTLTVTAAPFSPASVGRQAGAQFNEPLGAFRFAAAGGSVTLNGIMLTTNGSGDWAVELTAGDGVQLWLDDGNGAFSASSDTQVAQTSGAQPTVTLTLGVPLVIADGTSVDFWLVVSVTATAGASLPHTFQASIANVGDVAVSAPASVQLVAPLPQSSTLSIVIFFVTSFTPLEDDGNGHDIVVTGSGFTPPVNLSINGVVAFGTPVVNGTCTQITGLKTRNFGGGSGLSVVLSTGLLGPNNLPFTFRQVDTGAGTGPACTTSMDSTPAAPIGFATSVAILLAVVSRPRRRAPR